MSQKKYKKRTHSPAVAAKRAAEQEQIADEMAKSKNRMDPTARALMWSDLIFLAASALLYKNGLLSETLSNLATIIGAILILLALWFQFGRKRRGGKKL